jgi:hypothetical protein
VSRGRHGEAPFIPCDTRAITSQIGTRVLMSISGGRVIRRETGVTLPVASCYTVTSGPAPTRLTFSALNWPVAGETEELLLVWCARAGQWRKLRRQVLYQRSSVVDVINARRRPVAEHGLSDWQRLRRRISEDGQGVLIV